MSNQPGVKEEGMIELTNTRIEKCPTTGYRLSFDIAVDENLTEKRVGCMKKLLLKQITNSLNGLLGFKEKPSKWKLFKNKLRYAKPLMSWSIG